MSSTRSPCTHLLVSALAAILFLSLTAQAMPLSWRTARHRRSSSSEELPTQAGTLTERATESQRNPAGGSDGADQTDSCTEGAPPEDKINELKDYLLSHPHPMFFISEMAEKLHRKLYHKHIFPNHCDNFQTISVLNKTIQEVEVTILNYLNNNRLPTGGDVACPPQYSIEHYPRRYPRYLVQIVCQERGSSTTNAPGCENPSCGAGRECKPYQLADMRYLAKDSSDPSGWAVYRETSVGVGCKCSE